MLYFHNVNFFIKKNVYMKNNKHDAHFNILKIIKFELNKLKLMSLTFTKTYIFQ